MENNNDGLEEQIGSLIDALTKLRRQFAAASEPTRTQAQPPLEPGINTFLVVPSFTKAEEEPLSPPNFDIAAAFEEPLASPTEKRVAIEEPLAPPNLEPTANRPVDAPHPSLPTTPTATAPPLSPPNLSAGFRKVPPPEFPLDRIRRSSVEQPPPLEPPPDMQDLRHGFPYGNPYVPDIAAMQLYDETRDDLHNVSVDTFKIESDLRRRNLELHTRNLQDLNNDYRQLDELTRRAELSRESVTEVNI